MAARTFSRYLSNKCYFFNMFSPKPTGKKLQWRHLIRGTFEHFKTSRGSSLNVSFVIFQIFELYLVIHSLNLLLTAKDFRWTYFNLSQSSNVAKSDGQFV
jgi:hypothetical protein